MTRLPRLIVYWLAVSTAAAAPGPGVDPNSPVARWIRTLRDPDGVLCCDLADCRRTEIRVDEEGHRWAWIGRDEYGWSAPDQWRPISERVWQETMAKGDPPDGRAWVCYYGGAVRCAISGVQG